MALGKATNGTTGHERSHGPAIAFANDFYGWLLDQSSLLRDHRHSALDWNHLAEELEAMARSEEDALESQLIRLLKHLLKFRYQAHKVTGSWEASVDDSREQIGRVLLRSPSLKSKLDNLFAAAYPRARRMAGAEMRLRKRDWEKLIPASCEWPLTAVLNDTFWPQPLAAGRT
jgi:hypothetical protein